jgi:hypothetical protein
MKKYNIFDDMDKIINNFIDESNEIIERMKTNEKNN